MSKKKKVDRAQEAAADELLMRALRQLADEALEEEIPERLLRPLRAARKPHDGAAPPAEETPEPGPDPRAGSRSSGG
jgi:hypothetical protein